jgi:hypothetical protein
MTSLMGANDETTKVRCVRRWPTSTLRGFAGQGGATLV